MKLRAPGICTSFGLRRSLELRAAVGRIHAIGLGLAALLLAGGAFALGTVVGNDSNHVDGLSRALASERSQRQKETQRATELASALDQADAELEKLKNRPEPTPRKVGGRGISGAAGGGNRLRIGQTGNAGKLAITPTSFQKVSTSGDEATYEVVASIKNNGADDVSPFCGDTGAELVDSDGRLFDPTADISESSNTCESVQPGLTLDNFRFKFHVPITAMPHVLRLWGDLANEDARAIWSV